MTFISNPLVKKRNLEWELEAPSPSPSKKIKIVDEERSIVEQPEQPKKPATSAIETGDVQITDHLATFRDQLSKHIVPSTSLLPLSSFTSLYEHNAGHTHGAHFVIHQHDHPIAGTHYDLRLQINETSSASWAIMYGLPGNPNSERLNRNATETRIHCLWNHLIETASEATGSLLIWDTGTYSVLPRRSKHAPAEDPTSQPSRSPSPTSHQTPQERLHAAFQDRKIRLRLHGSKLPDPYVVYLRLTKPEDASGRAKSAATIERGPRRRRRRRKPLPERETSSDDSDPDEPQREPEATEAPPPESATLSAVEREIQELEDDHVRRTNAYTGASNTIGSVHQRRWYLSLDRRGSGLLAPERGRGWEAGPRDVNDGRLSYPFYVRGPEHETSVVSGRRSEDVLRDEGVRGLTGRKGWTPVMK